MASFATPASIAARIRDPAIVKRHRADELRAYVATGASNKTRPRRPPQAMHHLRARDRIDIDLIICDRISLAGRWIEAWLHEKPQRPSRPRHHRNIGDASARIALLDQLGQFDRILR